MQLIRFLQQETNESYHESLILASISGIANTLLIAIINHAAEAVANHEDLTQYFIIYMLSFTLFLYGHWQVYERSAQMVEDALFNNRIRLARKVQLVELEFMERIGNNELYRRLTQNDGLISQAVPNMIGAFQMLVLMILTFIYLGYISPLNFIISLIAMGLGILYFLVQESYIKRAFKVVKEKEENYLNSISHLINGFKEIKVNHAKGQNLLEQIALISNESKRIRSSARLQEARLWGFGRQLFYLVLPISIFIVPNFSHEHAESIYKVASTLLFIIGPTTVLVNLIPVLNQVNMAIEDLFFLEEEMDETIAHSNNSTNASDIEIRNFDTIRIDNLSFTYPGKNGTAFSVGPFNENITQGELLFIIGGNGSGKSTFLKLLSGLHYPDAGKIYVNNTPINKPNYLAYRNLFSIIFTDFHLFDKFYGLSDINNEKVNYWLKKMHMQHIVKYKNNGFTSTQLSTGQRKRLAFIAAMLEDKPILIIDEFAADQDPQFRQYFYESLLGEVRDMGKTIIAVTHDDHYFHVADRIWKMDEGRIELHSIPPE